MDRAIRFGRYCVQVTFRYVSCPSQKPSGKASAGGSKAEIARDDLHSSGSSLSQNCVSNMSSLTAINFHGMLIGRFRDCTTMDFPLGRMKRDLENSREHSAAHNARAHNRVRVRVRRATDHERRWDGRRLPATRNDPGQKKRVKQGKSCGAKNQAHGRSLPHETPAVGKLDWRSRSHRDSTN
jgi:hypothetical protein